MHHLRGWLAVFLLWLVAFFNWERLHVPITLTPLSFIVAALIAGSLIIAPGLHRLPLRWVLPCMALAYMTLKLVLGHSVMGSSAVVALSEVAGVGITLFLAARVRQGLESFREAVAEVMTSRLGDAARPFDSGQSEIYRELCRARHYKRPLALLAISVGNEQVCQSMHRFVEEAQRDSMRKYVAGRLAQLLADELKVCDILAQRGEHFLTLLPEADPAEVAHMVQRLETAALQKLGLELRVGTATFPDQEVTFDGLVERAEMTMLNSRPPVGVANVAEGSNPELNVVSIRIEGADARHVATGARAVASVLVGQSTPSSTPSSAEASVAEGT